MMLRKLKKVFSIFHDQGFYGVRRHIEWKMRQAGEIRRYRKWLRTSGAITDKDRNALLHAVASFKRKPLISIILPVYNIDEKWLRRCIESVQGQLYDNWELCIADDCSTAPHVRRVLNEYAEDERIKLVFRNENGHISAASNSALALATGEFTALLDHDDELAEDALFWVAKEINENPDLAMLYSDEDKISAGGVRFSPTFKPDWSRDLFYSINLVTHLSVYRTDILKRLGGFRVEFDGSQDYDLALRVIEQIGDDQIRHIPRILYHWRAIGGSVALSGTEKPYAHERVRDAIRSHFERLGVKAAVSEAVYDLHRVRYTVGEPRPKVSLVVIANKYDEIEPIADRIRGFTSYPEIEIALARRCGGLAAELNSAVAGSAHSILCFIEAGLTPESGDWLNELVSFALQPGIGCIGGKIVTKYGETADGAIVFGGESITNVAHFGFPGNAGGNLQRNLVISNFSAVSRSAMALRREVFDELGGFDSASFPNDLFDADLCLRVGAKGYRIVHSPYALFSLNTKRLTRTHAGSEELKRFGERWNGIVRRDPFCNPNLSARNGAFSLKLDDRGPDSVTLLNRE